MAKKTRKTGVSQRYAYMKQRIAKMQGKAKAFGLLYLLATIAITVLACLPLLVIEDGAITLTLGAASFWTVFTELGEGIVGKELNLAVAVIYGLMLLVLAINLLRSVSKLGWLFKRRASRLYGFNRNMYAMDDMGRRFSSSFAAIVAAHLTIALIVETAAVQPLAFAVLGVGVFFHFACGIPAGNVSLFETENGVVEQRREVGNFAPFVRNLLQLVIVAAVAYFFVSVAELRAGIEFFLAEGAMETLAADFTVIVNPALHLLVWLVLVGMIYYATGTIEFDMEGAEAAGRKRFLLLAIALLLASGGAFAYGQFVAGTEVAQNVMLIAAVAFAAIVVELVSINRPRVQVEDTDEVDVSAYLTENYDKPGVYMTSER